MIAHQVKIISINGGMISHQVKKHICDQEDDITSDRNHINVEEKDSA